MLKIRRKYGDEDTRKLGGNWTLKESLFEKLKVQYIGDTKIRNCVTFEQERLMGSNKF